MLLFHRLFVQNNGARLQNGQCGAFHWGIFIILTCLNCLVVSCMVSEVPLALTKMLSIELFVSHKCIICIKSTTPIIAHQFNKNNWICECLWNFHTQLLNKLFSDGIFDGTNWDIEVVSAIEAKEFHVLERKTVAWIMQKFHGQVIKKNTSWDTLLWSSD